MSSLRPVAGSAADLLALLREWDAAPAAEPLVVETSGSTGTPKRVVLSRAAMRASADATHRRLGGPGQWVLALPPTYVAGLQVLFRSVRARTEPVWTGGDLWRAADALTGRRRYLSLVPTQLRRALDEGHDTAALARFDAVLLGGAALDPGLRAEAEAVGARIVTTYGMSETCGGCVYDGRPLNGVKVSTTPDGRLRVRGRVLFDGYDGQPGLTGEVLRDGWFETQDLGRVTDSGAVEVLGRADDVVVSGGVNVPTDAVARTVRDHPEVEAAEVVGVEDTQWGTAVVAVVVGTVDRDALRGWVSREHPRAWAPQRVVHAARLPLLPNGKVDRLAVLELAAGRAGE